MDPQAALKEWMAGRSLSVEQSYGLIQHIVSGEVADGLIGGLLVASVSKGFAASEIAGFATFMRESAVSVPHALEGVIDTCGTGGGPATLNLSTGAAIIAASAGAKVAKHGNRSVTSKCGSADVLEASGVAIDLSPERQAAALEEVGLAFLFAPIMHPAMAKVGPVRRSLGVRTLFNVLGPLTNPARATRQLMGVYDPALVQPVAEALSMLGSQHAFVVHANDGYDEVSSYCPTQYIEVKDGQIRPGSWQPSDFGVADSLPTEWLDPGDSVSESARRLQDTLANPDRAEIMVPNAAVALVVGGLADDVRAGAALARAAVREGRASAKMAEIIKFR